MFLKGEGGSAFTHTHSPPHPILPFYCPCLVPPLHALGEGTSVSEWWQCLQFMVLSKWRGEVILVPLMEWYYANSQPTPDLTLLISVSLYYSDRRKARLRRLSAYCVTGWYLLLICILYSADRPVCVDDYCWRKAWPPYVQMWEKRVLYM